MSLLTEEMLSEKLTKALSPTHITVSEFSDGCGYKFDVVIVSTQFEGKPLLARHRLVNEALAEEMKTIHALTMKTYTPEQWSKMQGEK